MHYNNHGKDMIHKTYLYIILCLCLFAGAAVLGFLKPGLLDNAHKTLVETSGILKSEDIAIPMVPDDIFGAFAQDFSVVRAASEPMRLPDIGILSPDGKRVRLSSFDNAPTLVNMWATWCAPCVVELPSLQKFAEHYKGRMNVIAISLDPMKKHDEIQDFLTNRNLSDFAAYYDDTGRFGAEMGLRGIPTSFLIGKNGQILYRFEGDADWTTPYAQEFFDFILKEQNFQNR
jgi:thiol-disulfide isomerase/thioredoxin